MKPGRPGRAYLIGRGLTRDTIVHFGIGYAAEGWDGLANAMRQQGYTKEELLAAHLVSEGARGGIYDTFRNRAIFPIIDLRGNVIAFGGRNLGEKGPKYLNSSDTPVFKKSRNLFALNFAKGSPRKGLILCEGYMDVVSLHQAGFTNAVATLGTALTEEQCRLIAQYTGEVLLSYDSDGPGQAATQRATGLLEAAGVKIKVLSIPDAKDPDEFIKKFGAERFEQLIEGSSSRYRLCHKQAAGGKRCDHCRGEGLIPQAVCGADGGTAQPHRAGGLPLEDLSGAGGGQSSRCRTD